MGRNKSLIPLSKREKRLIREGKVSQQERPSGGSRVDGCWRVNWLEHAPNRRTGIDTRTSNNSNWLYAVGFVVLWFFARYTKGYYGKIFLDRGPRQERSTLDAATAARTVRCASEASAGPGPRAKRPSCDK